MPLTVGSHVGPYEVFGLIGAGGMGQVYRARYIKLDRDVALKVLPEAFEADPDRAARFQREAKTLASLNHLLHIAVIQRIEHVGLRDVRGDAPLQSGVTLRRQARLKTYGAHRCAGQRQPHAHPVHPLQRAAY